MRQIYLLTICLFTFGILSAQEENLSKEEKARREKNIQAGNPFAKYGYKAKVATLSKGKYLEVHDLDSIVTIGTIRWNVNQNKIVGNIVQDTTDMYAQPIGDTAGRWLSPDPLSDEFPEWSPYTSMNDNPIFFVDPTGLGSETVLDDYGIDQDGKIELIKPTDDSTDTLYSVTRGDDGELVKDNNGEVAKNDINSDQKVDTNDGATVQKGLLNNIENKTVTSDGKPVNLQMMDVSNGSFSDIKSIFEFSANNSSNEFTYTSFTNGNKFISTSFLPSGDISTTTLMQRNGSLLHHVHSHPLDTYFAPSPADINSAGIINGKGNGTRFELYLPLLGRYKDYNQNSSSFDLDPVIIKGKKKN